MVRSFYYHLTALGIVMLSAASLSAQPGHSCADARIKAGLARTATASPLEEHYDVTYVKLDLSMTNVSTKISGNATTVAKALSNLSQYAFELSDSLVIDSMKINGAAAQSFTNGNGLRTVNLVTPITASSTFTAQVFYHGTPPNGTGFFTHGVNNYTYSTTGTQITFTLSDPYLAQDWWPCKQSLTDKIDSADIWITVPAGLKAGCNGTLQAVTPMGSTSGRYQWKTKYPIDYYLISASVAPYIEYDRSVHFTSSADTMPITHFIYDTAANMLLVRSMIDSTGYMVDYLSTRYGRYPFWREKYGHCLAPLSGGMEHQTMTTIGPVAAVTTPLVAHELGHQWWGDCVTYGSWADIWMSEGWASYTEQLFVEHFWGAAAMVTYRTAVYNRVMGQTGGTVYVDDTTNANRIFDSRLTYDKGASVAHMLRYLAPNDSIFFAGLRSYQQQYAFKNAGTPDFKAVMAQAYGRPLDTFFRQWIYSEGYPTYTPRWNQIGNTVLVSLAQTTSKPASVAAFYLPVTLKLTSASGDTLVTVQDSSALQVFTFSWNRTMTGISIDPNNDIVNKAGAAVHDNMLSVVNTPVTSVRVYPNPARDSWQVSGIPGAAMLRLYDIQGRLLGTYNTDGNNAASVPAGRLPSGSYLIRIYQQAREIWSGRVQK